MAVGLGLFTCVALIAYPMAKMLPTDLPQRVMRVIYPGALCELVIGVWLMAKGGAGRGGAARRRLRGAWALDQEFEMRHLLTPAAGAVRAVILLPAMMGPTYVRASLE